MTNQLYLVSYFPAIGIGQGIAQGFLEIPKQVTSELLLCERLVQKEALTIRQDRVFAWIIFMSSIIIISFRKVHASVLDYSRKNKQTEGLRIWNFQSYCRNSK